nr:LacI family DNA-binding transcriptional regulator [uncultured Holophaga sp.]
MKLTIGEIARQAGVSTGTVSRVINGRSTVARETRANVLAVMKRLGYEPDPAARELSMRSQYTLGIWVGTGAARLSPYFSQVWRALLREIQTRATKFIELPTDLSTFRRRFDAALLFNCDTLDARVGLLAERRIPCVLIGHHPGISGVTPDDVGGGRLAAERLLELGHRRLLHLTVMGTFQWAMDRAAGFDAVRRAAGLPTHTLAGEGTVLGGYRLMREALKTGELPSGIFCATDEMAVGALGALADFGIPVPARASVIGFDGLVELHPGLSTVAQDIPAIAHQAVSLALAGIEHHNVRQVIVPVSLIEGRTLGPAPE